MSGESNAELAITGWVVRNITDGRRGSAKLVLGMDTEKKPYLFRLAPSLPPPLPSTSKVTFLGTLLDGETPFSPAVVLCHAIRPPQPSATALPEHVVLPWILPVEKRLQVIRNLASTPIHHYSNRCHDIMQAVTRAIAWDSGSRASLASLPNGSEALAAIARYAARPPHLIDETDVQAVAHVNKLVLRTSYRPTTASPEAEIAEDAQPSLTPEQRAIVEAFESSGSEEYAAAEKSATAGKKKGANAGAAGASRPGDSGGDNDVRSEGERQPRSGPVKDGPVRGQHGRGGVPQPFAPRQSYEGDDGGPVGPLWTETKRPVKDDHGQDSPYDDDSFAPLADSDLEAIAAFEGMDQIDEAPEREERPRVDKVRGQSKGPGGSIRPGGNRPKGPRRPSSGPRM